MPMFTEEFVNELCHTLSTIKFDKLHDHSNGMCECYEENEDGTEQRCDMCCIGELDIQGKSIIIDTYVEVMREYSEQILVDIDGFGFVIVVSGAFVSFEDDEPIMMLEEVKNYLLSL